MLKMKHTYEYDLSKINQDQMVVKLGMSFQEADTILKYRNRFALLEGGEGALVNLAELWEALEFPYLSNQIRNEILENGKKPSFQKALTDGFADWLRSVVIPECEALSSEISDFKEKRKGQRGSTKTSRFVSTDTAKHLAMLARSEAGREIRKYFITVERLFNSMVKHNALRIELHDAQKQFYAQDLLRRNYDKNATGKDLMMFNTLVKKASGGRNELKTNLDYYAACQSVIGNALLNGKDPEQLKRALC